VWCDGALVRRVECLERFPNCVTRSLLMRSGGGIDCGSRKGRIGTDRRREYSGNRWALRARSKGEPNGGFSNRYRKYLKQYVCQLRCTTIGGLASCRGFVHGWRCTKMRRMGADAVRCTETMHLPWWRIDWGTDSMARLRLGGSRQWHACRRCEPGCCVEGFGGFDCVRERFAAVRGWQRGRASARPTSLQISSIAVDGACQIFSVPRP
jgi:hypothetical protein